MVVPCMRTVAVVVIALLALAAAVVQTAVATDSGAADATHGVDGSDAPPVVDCNATSLLDAVTSYTVTAVVFYAPWCQECVNLEPEFRRAAQAVATMRTVASDGHITSARLVQVDGSQHHDLAEQYRITLFPTMLIFHRSHPQRPEQYIGPLSMQAVIDAVEHHVTGHSSPDGWHPARDMTIVLTERNFSRVASEHPLMLAGFVTSTCVHCQRFLPVLDSCAHRVRTRLAGQIPVAEVNCDTNTKLCRDLELERFPTALLFRHGRPYKFNERLVSGSEMLQRLVLEMPPASVRLDTAEALASAIGGHPQGPMVVFFGERVEIQSVEETDGPVALARRLWWAFVDSAYGVRGDNLIFRDAPAELAATAGLSLPNVAEDGAAVVLIQPPQLRSNLEMPYHVFDFKAFRADGGTGDDKASVQALVQALVDFYTKNRHGLAGLLTRFSQREYGRIRPLVVVYSFMDYSADGEKESADDQQSIEYRRTVRTRREVLSVARAFAEKGENLTFACANITDYWFHVHQLGIYGFDLPKETVVVGLWGGSEIRHPRYVMETPFSSQALHKFAQAYLDGRLAPYVNSHEEPQQQAGPVRRIVGSTYKREVLEAGVDVALMMEYDKELCPHCAAVLQLWERVASLVRDAGSNVKVTVVNRVGNELIGTKFDPPVLNQRPEVYVVPAADPTSSSLFTDISNMSVCTLLEFIASNSAPGALSLDAVSGYPAQLDCASARAVTETPAVEAKPVPPDGVRGSTGTAAATNVPAVGSGVPADVPVARARSGGRARTPAPAGKPAGDDEMATLAALAAGTPVKQEVEEPAADSPTPPPTASAEAVPPAATKEVPTAARRRRRRRRGKRARGV